MNLLVIVGAGAAAILVPLLIAAAAVYRRESATIESAMATGRAVVRDHVDTLARRRAVLVRVDPYGVSDETRWRAEVQHFVDKVLLPRLTDAESAVLRRGSWLLGFFAEEVEAQTAARLLLLETAAEEVVDLSPSDYEELCARALRRAGWTARTTQGSGDQGADVVAERNGVRLVVQCKLFGRPVGNKAVQEAFAAREHYGAHHAAVVSNADFTRAARELAGTTDVWLLHHSELDGLDGPVRRTA